MSHLTALQMNLSNERVRLANATTDAERDLRKVWVSQLEKEIEEEEKFFEIPLTDDELLVALDVQENKLGNGSHI